VERQRYFGDSINITDVFQDYESLVEFLISSVTQQAAFVLINDNINKSAWSGMSQKHSQTAASQPDE